MTYGIGALSLGFCLDAWLLHALCRKHVTVLIRDAAEYLHGASRVRDEPLT